MCQIGMGSGPPISAGQPKRLKDLGHDEVWLQNWLSSDPRRLGLGEVSVKAQELTQAKGGSLDIWQSTATRTTALRCSSGR